MAVLCGACGCGKTKKEIFAASKGRTLKFKVKFQQKTKIISCNSKQMTSKFNFQYKQSRLATKF